MPTKEGNISNPPSSRDFKAPINLTVFPLEPDQCLLYLQSLSAPKSEKNLNCKLNIRAK